MTYSDYPEIEIPYAQKDVEHLMDLIQALREVIDSGNMVSIIRRAEDVTEECFSMVTEKECEEMDHYNAWCKKVGLE